MKIKICIEPGCKNAQTTKNFCRLHYLKNWKEIKDTEKKKAADRLNKYVEGICKKYPEKYIDVIRRELRSDKGDFALGDDGNAGDLSEEMYENLGFQDDESLDKLVSRIKLDKDF